MSHGERLKNLRGAVVQCIFPFSDQTQSKSRPVFVIVELEGDDFIACRVSSQPISKYDKHSILINSDDFEFGSLPLQSKVYPNSLTTLSKNMIKSVHGKLKKEKQDEIINKIIKIISGK